MDNNIENMTNNLKITHKYYRVAVGILDQFEPNPKITCLKTFSFDRLERSCRNA